MDDINKSVKIQSQEARNKDLMTLKFASIKKQAREVRVGTQAASRKPLLQVHVRNRIYGAAVYGQ